jgi:23S rRNA 5-hydroxycytidine C2501 synthase
MADLPGIICGTTLNRNRDHRWEQQIEGRSAERKIAVTALLEHYPDQLRLTYHDEDQCSGSALLPLNWQAARDPIAATEQIRQALARLGDSDFTLEASQFNWSEPPFIPLSQLNALRRQAIQQLEEDRLRRYLRPQRRAADTHPPAYPEIALSYLANVYNRAAAAFYQRHGVESIAPAYEAHAERGEVSLMITRHCLRWSFSLCPKQAKGITGVQGAIRADNLWLINGNERLRLEFDCAACEMHVKGKIRRQVLQQKGLPASAS